MDDVFFACFSCVVYVCVFACTWCCCCCCCLCCRNEMLLLWRRPCDTQRSAPNSIRMVLATLLLCCTSSECSIFTCIVHVQLGTRPVMLCCLCTQTRQQHAAHDARSVTRLGEGLGGCCGTIEKGVRNSVAAGVFVAVQAGW